MGWRGQGLRRGRWADGLLLVVSGQSNAQGVGDPGDLPHNFPRFKARLSPDIAPVEGGFVGPGLVTAEALCDRYRTLTVDVVSKTKGGTSVQEWQPGTSNYADLLSVVQAELPTSRRLVLLWYQGEDDTKTLDKAEAWGGFAQTLFDQARLDFRAPNMPVVVVQLPEQQPDRADTYTYWSTVRAQQQSVAKTNQIIVEAPSGPYTDDGLHLATAAQLELGERIAKALTPAIF